MLTSRSVVIMADPDVPDGVLRAYDKDGNMVIEITLAPVYMATTLLSPLEPDIHLWKANPLAVERYAAMRQWFKFGHYTMGAA